jgi:hypothetical protein
MNKTDRVKIIAWSLEILLCLSLIQTACAQVEGSEENIISENVTYGNGTYESVAPGTETTDEGGPSGSAVVHTISPTSHYTYLVAGNSESFNVSFKNEGDETLTVTPKVALLNSNGNGIVESWITISPTEETVAQGESKEFTVKINVPENAGSGYYQAVIAFTDDLQPNSANYVNAMQLEISVQAKPKIELQSTYIYDTVKAGQEYEYRIKIKNIVDEDVTIDPKVTDYSYDISSNTLGINDEAIEISAPSVIKAGEIVSMTIKVPVPEKATGSYNGYIDMNVDGKKSDGSNSQISLYLRAIQEPTVPYVKTFSTTSNAPITIDVSANSYDQTMGLRISPKIEEPSFKVKLKYNSRSLRLTPTKIVQNSNVNSGINYFPAWALDDSTAYQDSNAYYSETYTVPGAIGKWELTIMPKNTENFGYSITFGK